MNTNPKKFDKAKQLSVEFFTGIFFIGALFLLLYFTALVDGKDLFMGKKHFNIKVQFPSIGSLAVNDIVSVRGMEIGRVKSFKMSKDYDKVLITLNLSEKLPIHKDYSIEIRNSSMFGGKFVHIDTGTSKSGLCNYDQVFTGEPPIDILTEASSLVASLKKDENDFREKFLEGQIIDNISNAAKSFEKTSGSLREYVKKIKTSEGTLAKLIDDPALYDDAKKMCSTINGASGKIDKLVAEVNGVVDGIKEGKGTLGKLVSDDAAYNKLLAAIEDFKKTSQQISSGKGSLGKIISDDGTLYDTLKKSLTAAQDLSNQLKEGKGTLGKLVTDDTLYNDMRETVRQIRAAVEDYREQSPIATFGSLVLGAL